MSSYDPYRFLPGQRPPPRPTADRIHIPVYAEPDLDPSSPLPDSQNHHISQMSSQDEAGPSRKRARESEGSTAGNGNGYHHATEPVLPVMHDRPVPVSMFGFDARNDLTREIGDWLMHTCRGRENIEVCLHNPP
jgi:hypothetical protein